MLLFYIVQIDKIRGFLKKMITCIFTNNANLNAFSKVFCSTSVTNQCRRMSSKVLKLEFNEFGNPGKVLKLTESTYEQPGNDQVSGL